MDLRKPIRSLLESEPLCKLSEDDRMIVAGQLAGTMQMLLAGVDSPALMTPEEEREELEDYGKFMSAMHAEAPTDGAKGYFRNQVDYAEGRLSALNGLEGDYKTAMRLLERAVATEMPAPDKTWFQEYFALTGEWMILTDEGWEQGGARETYEPGEILDEVNAPVQPPTQSDAESAHLSEV